MLEHLTVLDLSSVGPAARASAMLADYGARVIKVAPVPRDGGKQIAPPAYAYSGLRGTERAQIDLKSPAGRHAFLALAAGADVVIESFRPGVIERLGIGPDDLRAAREDVIVCSTTGYGRAGAAAARAGHDLNYQAVSGALDCAERAPHEKPALPGATFADSAGGGMQAVIAILAALARRDAGGGGAHLDVSITRGMLSLMSLAVDEHLATGVVPGPGHGVLTGRYAWYDTYRCTDGWVAVAAIEGAFFANLCRLLGCDRWIDRQYDDGAQEAMREDFAIAFGAKPRDEWLAVLGDADTCVSPVLSVPEVVQDDDVAAGLVTTVTHPVEGEIRQLGALLAGMPAAARELPDPRGSDTDRLLAEAGMSPDEIAALHAEGVVA